MRYADMYRKPNIAAPAAWLHTMYMEGGQISVVVTSDPESPFGEPGVDHSACYPVTSEPLYRRKIINKPRVLLSAKAVPKGGIDRG
jgi:hypothetical protein